MISRVRVEPARQHGLENGSVAALGRHVHHQMMLCAQLATKLRIASEHRVGARAIATSTSGGEALQGRKLVLRTSCTQPGSDCFVAVQFGYGECRAAIAATLM